MGTEAVSTLRRGSPRYRRTTHQLALASLDVDRIRPDLSPADATRLNALVQRATEFMTRRDVDGAWHCLNALGREVIAHEADAIQTSTAASLLQEASKIDTPWRQKAIVSLLEPASADRNIRIARLQEAMRVRDDHFENRYHRIAMHYDQLRNLWAVASVSLIGIFLTVWFTHTPVNSLGPWDPRLLLLVVLFGLAGSSLSGFRSLTSLSRSANIPDSILNDAQTFGRTVFGALIGVVAYTLLNANLINVSLGAITPAVALAVAFMAGFSERLLVQAIASIAGSPTPDAKPGTPPPAGR